MSDMQPQGVSSPPPTSRRPRDDRPRPQGGRRLHDRAWSPVAATIDRPQDHDETSSRPTQADAKARTLPRSIVDTPIDGPGSRPIRVGNGSRSPSATWAELELVRLGRLEGRARPNPDRPRHGAPGEVGTARRGKVDKFHPRQGSSKATGLNPSRARQGRPRTRSGGEAMTKPTICLVRAVLLVVAATAARRRARESPSSSPPRRRRWASISGSASRSRWTSPFATRPARKSAWASTSAVGR